MSKKEYPPRMAWAEELKQWHACADELASVLADIWYGPQREANLAEALTNRRVRVNSALEHHKKLIGGVP